MEQVTIHVNCPSCGRITEIVCPFLRENLAVESVEAVTLDEDPTGSYNDRSGATCALCHERMKLYWSFDYYTDTNDSDDSDSANEDQLAEQKVHSLKENNERVVIQFPTRNGRVISGPYPYRFEIDIPQRCAILLYAKIWAAKATYENVIKVCVDERPLTDIRQGYERDQFIRLELGELNSGRHTISFDAHFEASNGEPIKGKDADLAKNYWILKGLVIVC